MQQFYKYFPTYFAMLITLNAKNIIKERNRVIQIHSVQRLDHAVLREDIKLDQISYKQQERVRKSEAAKKASLPNKSWINSAGIFGPSRS